MGDGGGKKIAPANQPNAANLKQEKLVVLAAEVKRTLANKARITPKRQVSRQTHTAEHLVSEADLGNIENCDGGLLYNLGIFFFGGALSLFPQSVSIVIKWWSQKTPSTFDLLDVTNMIVFAVCVIVGVIFLRVSPRPNQKLQQITDEIRTRPKVDAE